MPGLPDDTKAEVIRDQSRFIETSMEEVHAPHARRALVSASILLFLRDWRTTLIATLSIPTSLVGTFAFMDVMGFTINNFTMLGLISRSASWSMTPWWFTRTSFATWRNAASAPGRGEQLHARDRPPWWRRRCRWW
jgi:hypothetical protein